MQNKISNINGNFLIIDVSINNNWYNLVNIYGPNTESPEFYVNLYKELEKSDNPGAIMCGDFNIIFDKDIDIDHVDVIFHFDLIPTC